MRMRKWTPEEDAHLRKLVASGLDTATISARMRGRNDKAVRARRAQLGISTPRNLWTPAQDAALAKLWPTDMPSVIIAAEIGRPQEALSSRAAKLGLPKRGHVSSPAMQRKRTRPVDGVTKQWPRASIAQLRRMWLDDVALTVIAAHFGVTRSTIQGKARHIGLPNRQYLSGNNRKQPRTVERVMVETRDDERALIEAAMARGRVTRCPPAYVAPVQAAERLSAVPVYDPDDPWRAGFQV